MSKITLESIAKVVEEVVKLELAPIKKTLAEHTTTLNLHTTILDGIANADKTKDTEATMVTPRLDRHEKWLKQIADHVGVTLKNESSPQG